MGINNKSVLKSDLVSAVAYTITNKCNFNCMHCFNDSGTNCDDELSDSEVIDLAYQIQEIKPASFCICGGEPLMRGEVVYDFIELISKSCGQVNIVSNGYVFDEKIARRLLNCGIHTIQFSIDGKNPFEHDSFRRKRGAFNRVLSSIDIAKSVGLSVITSSVPNRLNYKSFAEMCKICYEKGIKDFRSMPLIPMGRASEVDELLLTSEEMSKLQEVLHKEKRKYINRGMDVQWGDPMDHLYRMPENAKLGFPSYMMDIRADGKIGVSTYFPIVVGDCRKHTLKEYWDNGYRDIWKNSEVLELFRDIECIYDFCKVRPEDGDKYIEIDLMEGK